MSQHHFSLIHEGVETHVLMGWDKPTQGYFLVIEKDSDDDEPFWSNLNRCTDPHPKTLDPFIKVLKELNIEVPQNMITAVKKNGLDNAENEEVWY
jgi:hypothetical protein